jgi:DNA-binding CsgD family transcriptional regulator
MTAFLFCRDQASFDAAVATARRTHVVQDGLVLRNRHWNDAGELVCVGKVESDDQAASALLVAAHGARLVLHVPPEVELAPAMLEDLGRLGTIQWRDGAAASTSGLDEDERRLLELLGDGFSLGEAARRLYLSRRTADRRLHSARRVLGVETTAEAIIKVCPPTGSRCASTGAHHVGTTTQGRVA